MAKAISPTKGSKIVDFAQFKKELANDLSEIRNALCGQDNKEASDKLEEVLEIVEGIDKPANSVSAKYVPLYEIERKLEEMNKMCTVKGCADGTRPKTDEDNKKIDEATEQTKKHLAEAKKIKDDLLEEAAKNGKKYGQLIDDINKKINYLTKILGAWNYIKAAICVPRELMSATKKYLYLKQHSIPDTGQCNVACKFLGKWFADMTGGPAQQKFGTDECLALCN
jgi:hypothetical protein